MLLTLGSVTAYARATASQASLGTATTLGFRARVGGSLLLNSAPTSSLVVAVRGGTSYRLQVSTARAGGDVYVALSGPGGSNPQCVAIIDESAFAAAESYVLRGWGGPGGCTIEVWSGDGVLIGSQSVAGVTLSNPGTSNGQVWIGDVPDLTGTTGTVDGVAIYDREPPPGVASPHPDDPGILWAVVDGAGNLVEGATDLEDYNAATWGPGGDWDRPEPAPTYSGALSAAAQPATASIAGAHAAPVPIGALAAAAGAALVAIAGAYAPPAGGALSAQAQSATASISGAYEAPIIGSLSATAGAATAALSGLFEFPEPRWGTVGDSTTDEYRGDDNRGGGTQYAATTLNWLELLAGDAGQPAVATHNRGLNVGAWSSSSRGEPRRRGFARNWARSGATMSVGGQGFGYLVSGQLPGLAGHVEAGTVTHAVIQLTSNEWMNYTPLWGPNIYDGNGTTAGNGWTIPQVVASVVDDAVTCIDALVEAGAAGIVVLGLFDFAKHPGIVEVGGWSDPVRRGYVTGAIDSINAAVSAHCASINAARGYTVCAFRPLDYHLQDEVWPTADGRYVTMAGARLDYLDSSGFEPNLLSIPGHAGTILGGVWANTFIAAANQLPGVSIEPFSDREIRENAGIFADEVTGALAATADPASAQLTGAHTAPTYAGELSATAQAASSAITGAHTAPAYAGALGASAGAATASLSGTHAAPQEDGALRAAAQPAMAAIAGTYAAPVHVGQLVALAGSATAQIAGVYAVPAGGTLRAAAQPATAVVTGSYAAPGAVGTLAAGAQPATAQVAGTHSAPVWAGSVAAVAGPASAAIAGRYAAPGVIVGRLRAAAAPASAHIEAEYTYSGVVHPVRATLSVTSIRPTLTVSDA